MIKEIEILLVCDHPECNIGIAVYPKDYNQDDTVSILLKKYLDVNGKFFCLEHREYKKINLLICSCCQKETKKLILINGRDSGICKDCLPLFDRKIKKVLDTKD